MEDNKWVLECLVACSSLGGQPDTVLFQLRHKSWYNITDSTHIPKVTLMKLTSLSKTKPELTAFLARMVMEKGEATGKQVIVAWASVCKATNKDVSHLQYDHEEAATKIILQVLDATTDTATEFSIGQKCQTLSRDVPKYKWLDQQQITKQSSSNQL